MRLPEGWRITREMTEPGIRRVTLVRMPPQKTGGWSKETAEPRPEDRVKGLPRA